MKVGGGGGVYNDRGTVILNDSASVSGNRARIGGGIFKTGGTLTMKNSSSVSGNTAYYGGGISNYGTVSACDSSGVDEWIGTVEPNDPNDFRDSDVTLITC